MYSPIRAYAFLRADNHSINVEYVTTYKQYYLFQDNDYKLVPGKNMSLRTMIQPMIRVNMFDGKISVFKSQSSFMLLKTSSEIEAHVLKNQSHFNKVWIQDDYALRKYTNEIIGNSLKLLNNLVGISSDEIQKIKIAKSCTGLVDKTIIDNHYTCLPDFIDVINETLKIRQINQDLKECSIDDFDVLNQATQKEVIELINDVYDLSKTIIKTE